MAINLSAINATLDAASSTLSNLLASFGQNPPSSPAGFSAMSNDASTYSNAAAQAANDAFANTIASQVTGALSNEFDSIQKGFNSLENGITSSISTAFNGVGTVFNDLKSSIQGGINALGNEVQQGWSTLSSDISSGFNFVVQDISNGLSSLAQGISTAVGGIVDAVGQEVDKVAGVVATGINNAYQIIVQEGQTILATVESIPKAVAQVATDITSSLGKIFLTTAGDIWKSGVLQETAAGLEAGARDLGAWYKDVIVGVVTEFLPFTDAPPDSDFSRDVARIGAAAFMEQLAGSIEEATPQVAFIISALLNKVVESIDIGSYRDLQYIGNWQEPNMMPGLGDIIEGMYRGNLSDKDARVMLQKLGFNTANAQLIFDNALALYGVTDLVNLYYRGIISSKDDLYARAAKVHANKDYVDSAIQYFEQLIPPNTAIEMWRRNVLPQGWTDFFDDAKRMGWTPERIKAFKDISYVVPDVGTLKQFIIHQVDDDTIALKYGLDKGITQDYYDRARMNGWTEADAKRMYRMSWVFPPFFILESLYKSGQISKEDFTTIMAFTGIPDYFISSFADSLAPKLTSADIKDMYKYQVITGDQIPAELAKIGISADLAQQLKTLWEASVKLASPQDQTGAQAKASTIKGLSESIIKENYIDGAITKDQATAYLKEIGYAQEEIDLNINIWDITIHKAIVSSTISYLKTQVKARAMTLNDAITQLQTLNLQQNQVNQYITELTNEVTLKDKTPTLAEVTKWFKDSLLTTSEYINALEMLGYAKAWIPYYLVVAGMTPNDVENLGFTFTAFGT